jgi:sialidase-1
MNRTKWALPILLLSLSAAVPAESGTLVCVDGGEAKGVRVEGAAWKTAEGALVCEGTGNFLYAPRAIGAGDFRVEARLAIGKLAGSAASFVIGGESHFGFCGGHGEMFVEGPLFGGSSRGVGKPADFLAEGKTFAFEAVRTGGTLRIAIDGREAFRAEVGAGPLGSVGFRPWRSRMRIVRFAVTGTLVADETAGPEGQVDVFTSGTGGCHTYRIPALVVTKKGTLLAFCEGRRKSRSDTGDIDLVVRRSADDGKTWGPMQVVWDDAGNTCGNPCPVVDRETGTIWLPMTWNSGKTHERQIKPGFGPDSRRVFVTGSTDDGRTWAEPREITPDVKKAGWTWYATGPGAGIQIRNGRHRGRLVIPCDHKDPRYYSHVIYSDDHGKTWALGGTTPQDRVNECEVVELKDGALMLNMRNYDRSKKARQVAISSDGGMTWADQRFDAALVEPICQASIRRHTWPGADGPGAILFSNPASAKGRVRMTVRLSRDEGRTWPVSRLIHAGGSAYSCLAVLPDGTVGLLYERGGYRTITFARFTLGWLEGGE